MLVLTRKEGESIVIGNDVKVSIVSVGPGRVKVGIEAPKWMAIDRQEVHDRKQIEMETDETVKAVIHNRLSDQYQPIQAPGGPRKSR
ncbi:MAG: carbon storage regulator [Gemmataceae bacterium]